MGVGLVASQDHRRVAGTGAAAARRSQRGPAAPVASQLLRWVCVILIRGH